MFEHSLALLLVSAVPTGMTSPVTSGPGNDYQPAILRAADGSLRLAFERLDASAFGDLWLSRSDDDGASWTAPLPAIASSANERHPALLQLGDGSFVLFYLKGSAAASSYRLYRATSADGGAFVEQGALQLGWPTGGEVNPHVIRHPDGTLTLSYHRLGGASYVAQSSDDGASWDQLRTALTSGNSQLPRIARRASDGRYLATWQVGSSNLALYARSTLDLRDWSGPLVELAIAGDNHDALPFVLPDGAFGVFYIHAEGGQYDIYSRRSSDGLAFEPALPQVIDASGNDVQPHALVGDSASSVQLYWGRQALPGGSYAIWRKAGAALVADSIHGDGFE